LATLLSIGLYSLAKLLFVVIKMDLFPFTRNTLLSLGIIGLTFIAFYFWNFPFHPIINIILKSVLLSFFYLVLNYKLKISVDINDVIEKILKRIHIMRIE